MHQIYIYISVCMQLYLINIDICQTRSEAFPHDTFHIRCLNQVLRIAAFLLVTERLPDVLVLWTFARFPSFPRYFSGTMDIQQIQRRVWKWLGICCWDHWNSTTLRNPASCTVWGLCGQFGQSQRCGFASLRPLDGKWLAATVTWRYWIIGKHGQRNKLLRTWWVLMWSQKVQCGLRLEEKLVQDLESTEGLFHFHHFEVAMENHHS